MASDRRSIYSAHLLYTSVSPRTSSAWGLVSMNLGSACIRGQGHAERTAAGTVMPSPCIPSESTCMGPMHGLHSSDRLHSKVHSPLSALPPVVRLQICALHGMGEAGDARATLIAHVQRRWTWNASRQFPISQAQNITPHPHPPRPPSPVRAAVGAAIDTGPILADEL